MTRQSCSRPAAGVTTIVSFIRPARCESLAMPRWLTTRQLPAGPTGPQGPAGPPGPAGAAGPPGVIGAVTVRSQSVVIPGGVAENAAVNTARVTSLCSGNERAISGGTSWSDDDANLELYTSELEPQLNPQNQVVGFLGVGANDSGQASTFTVHALCYTP